MASSKPILFCTAAPAEAAAVVRGITGHPDGGPLSRPVREWDTVAVTGRHHVLATGIGKVNAAVAAALKAHPDRYAAVVNLGIGGSLPASDGGPGLPLRSIVVSSASIYADEGLATPDGFSDCAAMGFPIGGMPTPCFEGSSIESDPRLRRELLAALETAVEARVATVSTCSGRDDLAAEIARRTGAAVEAMEGAAIAHALLRLHGGALPFAEVRVVSNTTGDRARQRWDIKAALQTLADVTARLAHLAPDEPGAPPTGVPS